jgi:hypothetical protein
MKDINVDLIEHFKYYLLCMDNESNDFSEPFNEKTGLGSQNGSRGT